jgi:hypothetical protein
VGRKECGDPRDVQPRVGPTGAEVGRREARGRARVAGAMRREAYGVGPLPWARLSSLLAFRDPNSARGAPWISWGVRTPECGVRCGGAGARHMFYSI